ncbi:MAG TPA: superoxide dismutase family protein [Longimicrobium sp.]|nr:superoxide dismutase family protein [Longimicrobium sp.]
MKGMIRTALGGAAVMVLAACGSAAPGGGGGSPTPLTFTVPLYDAQGQEVARATLTQAGRDTVHLAVDATRLPAGTHGTHLHEAGRCEPPQFTTAGGHLNPLARKHGLRNPQGPHLGDLPNLVVGANGQGHMEARILASLRPGQPPIFDVDGTALVVHAGADDMVTDPSGNSGARIACAVIATPAVGS